MTSIPTEVLIGTDQTLIDASIIPTLKVIGTRTDTILGQIVEHEPQGETQALTLRLPIQSERRTLENQRTAIERPIGIFTTDNA